MLDTSSNALHVIDGNSFLIDLFRRNPNGLSMRETLDTVGRMRVPPVFIFDGKGGNERRRALYPDYKTKRVPQAEDIFASINLFRECLAYTSSVTISVPGWEADDVVATTARRAAARGETVSVITTDRDLYQLADNPRINVSAKYEHVEPIHVRLYKTMVGDPSDNIAGVPRFGEKSWEALDKQAALALMVEDVNFGQRVHTIGLSRKHADWCFSNYDKLRAMWEIVGLYEVPRGDIAVSLRVGVPDPKRLDAKLKEYLF